VSSDIELLRNTLIDFWNKHILTGVAPAVDASEATKDSLDSLASRRTYSEVLPNEVETVISDMNEAKERMDYYATIVDEKKNIIRNLVGGFGKYKQITILLVIKSTVVEPSTVLSLLKIIQTYTTNISNKVVTQN